MKKTLSLVFKLYLLLMPFKLLPILKPIREIFSSVAAISNCLFVMGIGLILLMIYTRGVMYLHSELLRRSFLLVFLLILISLATSAMLFPVFGTLFGETTFHASFSTNVYYLLIAVVFFFNAHLLELLTKEDVAKIMDLLCVFVIAVGMIQMLIILGLTPLASVYDRLDVLDILTDSSLMINIGRICLTGVEPSSAGVIVCCFLLPYALSQLMTTKHKQKYLVYSVAFFVLGFFSLSSAVLVGLVANLALFFLISSKHRGGVSLLLVFLLIGSTAFILIVESGVLEGTYVGDKLTFLLREKTTDTSNLSSGYRYTTVVNDIACFVRYPISGVGNGNQGFLYNETMNSSWVSEAMRNNYQTVSSMTGRSGVMSGGAFVPAFISGYGLIGVALLLWYLSAVRRRVRASRQELGYYYFWFCIGGLAFAVISTAAASIEGNFIVMFVLSLPFAAEHTMQKKEDVYGPRNLRDYSHPEPGRGPAADPGQLRRRYPTAGSGGGG